jgi:pilus assembly protein CpaD
MRFRLFSLAAGVVTLALSACASGSRPAELATTPTEQWTDRVQVIAHPDSIRLGVHADGPSANQAKALTDFVVRWMQAEGGVIQIQAPRGASPRMISGVYQLLTAQGASPSAVKLSSYEPGDEPSAPIVVGFERYEAITPKCGLDWESLTKTRHNEAFGNFGCAITANIAAQVANPEDLIRPRDSTPVDAQRRTTVLDAYRRGEITSSASDDQATGAISRAVN